MTPVEKIAALYEQHGGSFREVLEAHLLHGYVYSTPDCFLIGRAVNSAAPLDEILDPWRTWEREQQDAWWVYAMAGDIRRAMKFTPYELPKIGFERRGVTRYYSSKCLAERLSGKPAPSNLAHGIIQATLSSSPPSWAKAVSQVASGQADCQRCG